MTRRSIPGRTACLLLFPGALGDFLCFLPTVDAIAAEPDTDVTLVAKAAHRALLGGRRLGFVDIDRREVSELFATECGAGARRLLGGFDRALSWTGDADPRFRANLTAITNGPCRTFPFGDFAPGEHAVDHFARRAGVTPGSMRIIVGRDASRWAREEAARLRFDDETLVVHSGSGSRRKNWQGMGELAGEWRRRGGRVVALIGPADDTFDSCDAAIADQSIDRIAAILEIAPFFVGNDSGIAHLAGAVSCPGVVVFGDTDPSIWRPRSDRIGVVRAASACAFCGPDRLCTHRLAVRDVISEVDRQRSESYRRRS